MVSKSHFQCQKFWICIIITEADNPSVLAWMAIRSFASVSCLFHMLTYTFEGSTYTFKGSTPIHTCWLINLQRSKENKGRKRAWSSALFDRHLHLVHTICAVTSTQTSDFSQMINLPKDGMMWRECKAMICLLDTNLSRYSCANAAIMYDRTESCV